MTKPIQPVTGEAYSSADQCNTIMSSAGDTAGNDLFAPAPSPVLESPRALILEVFEDLRPALAVKYPDHAGTIVEQVEKGI